MNHILEVINLKKKYGSFEALKGISFSVARGEVIGVLGPSGCGKSTLLQLIAGLQSPDNGEIRIDGRIIATPRHITPPEKRHVNMVFQDYALWPHMTIYENIAYGLVRSRTARTEREQKIKSLLDMFKLNGLEKRFPPQLSGGQQQRVAIARALATNPDLLLMDEPLSNLDKRLRIDMRTEMAYLFSHLGQSVIYVTHDPEEAFALSNRLLMIRDGRLEQIDTPATCFEHPVSEWAASLTGATNRLTGKAIMQREGHIMIQTGTQEIQAVTFSRQPLEDRAAIMFRPEDVRIAETPVTGGNLIDVRTVHCMFEGNRFRILAETENKERLAFFASHPIPAETALRISIKIGDTFAYATNL